MSGFSSTSAFRKNFVDVPREDFLLSSLRQMTPTDAYRHKLRFRATGAWTAASWLGVPIDEVEKLCVAESTHAAFETTNP